MNDLKRISECSFVTFQVLLDFFLGGKHFAPKCFKVFNHHHGIANYINLKQPILQKKTTNIIRDIDSGGCYFSALCKISCDFLDGVNPAFVCHPPDI